MKENIPYIKFNPTIKKHSGFEIVSTQEIARKKKKYDHDPELPHQLEFFNLIFFTSGAGRHFIDFNWYPVRQNSLIYLTKEQVTAFDFSKELKGYCVIFTEEYFVNCFSHLPKDFVFRIFNPELYSPILQIPKESDFSDYFNLLRKEFKGKIVLNQEAILDSLFSILLLKAENLRQNDLLHLNKNTSKFSLFQKFIFLLELKFSESRSAEFYAKELAVTYKHLNVVCKELVHKTAKSVINDFIILQAKRNLVNSTIKSSELAYKIGFDSPTNFVKYFKKNTGLTPNMFKNLINKY